MLVRLPPANYRLPKGKGRPKERQPAALVLASALYNWTGPWVRLTFDRAIGISGMDVAAVTVKNTADTDTLYGGTGTPTAVSAVTVQVALTPIGSVTGTGENLLSVTANNGIVAEDDGGTWAGVTDMVV